MPRPPLIDTFLPEYTFGEYHHTLVHSPVKTVFACARDVDMSGSRLIRTLFALRGLPTRNMTLRGFVADVGFTNIAENQPTELLIGFWVKRKIRPITDPEAFRANAISARIRVVWNFRCEEAGEGQTRLSTETRVLCRDALTTTVFGLYWFAIRPFSGAIRKELLRIIKQDAESIEGREQEA